MIDSAFARFGQSILLIEPTAEGIFLYVIRPDGFVGDTWHATFEEAQAQASFTAGRIVGPWTPIPADVKDKIAFAKTRG